MPDDGVTILIPSVTAVTLTPNPATINGSMVVKIAVSEISKTLYPYPYYLGEIYCGEI